MRFLSFSHSIFVIIINLQFIFVMSFDFDRTRTTLIELVRDNEPLWNQRNKAYHMTKAPQKKAKWDEIGTVLNVNGK